MRIDRRGDPLTQVNISMAYELLRKRELNKAMELFRTISSKARLPRTKMDAFIGMGLVLRDSGDMTGAMGMMSKALEMDPTNNTANFNMGNLYEEMDQHALAIQNYEKVISHDPSNNDAYNNRGVSWFHVGNIKEALNDFKNALEIDPRDPRPLVNSGICNVEEKHYETAIDLFDIVLKMNSENVFALLGKGLALYYLDRYDDSIICFEAATSIKRDFYIAHYYKATILRKLDLLEEAEEAIMESIRIRKDYSLGFFELGNIRKTRGDIKGALEAYEKAENMSRGIYEEVLFEIGRIYLHELDEPKIALSYFKKIITKNPNIAKVWYESSIAFEQNENTLDKAKSSIENAIHLGLEDLTTKRSLAQILVKMKDPKGASVILDELTDRYPDPVSHLMRANIEYAAREYNDAIYSAEQALSLDPNLHEALLVLGKSYNSLGKVEEYKQCLRRYTAVRPDDIKTKEELELLS